MENVKPLNNTIVSPELVLRRALSGSQKGALVACVDQGGQLNVQWSSMPLEMLCFLKDYVNLAVQDQLQQRMQRIEPTIG